MSMIPPDGHPTNPHPISAVQAGESMKCQGQAYHPDRPDISADLYVVPEGAYVENMDCVAEMIRALGGCGKLIALDFSQWRGGAYELSPPTFEAFGHIPASNDTQVRVYDVTVAWVDPPACVVAYKIDLGELEAR